MEEDTYTEVTTESWGSRLGNSLKGVIVGIILFVAAIPLLFWNEGRAVKTTAALQEAESVCTTLPAIDKVDPQFEGKMVYATGDAVTEDVLSDNMFQGVSRKAIRLRRDVEYYQWEEESSTREEKQVGGGTRKVTTYSYHKRWVSHPINSSHFKRAGHENTVHFHGVEDQTQVAKNVNFGAYTLSDTQINSISGEEDLPLADIQWPEELKGRTAVRGNTLYIGRPVGYYAGMMGMSQPAPVQPAVMAQTAPVPAEKIAELPVTTMGGSVTVPGIQPVPLNVANVDGVPFVVLPDGTATPVMPHGVCWQGTMQGITAAVPGNGTAIQQNPMVQYACIPNYGSLPIFMLENRMFVRLATGALAPYVCLSATNGQVIVNGTPIPVTTGTSATTPAPAYNTAPAVAAQPVMPQQVAPQQQSVRFSTANPSAPEIGDVRITWTYIPETMPVSIASVQKENSFVPYIAENGYDVNLLYTGTHSMKAVFQKAHNENTILTWILRLVGWVMMFIGVQMILKPLSVLADVLPIAGDIVEVGTSLIAFLVSAISALVVIAIAWLFYRPVLSICLLAVVGVLVYMLISRRKKARASKAASKHRHNQHSRRKKARAAKAAREAEPKPAAAATSDSEEPAPAEEALPEVPVEEKPEAVVTTPDGTVLPDVPPAAQK